MGLKFKIELDLCGSIEGMNEAFIIAMESNYYAEAIFSALNSDNLSEMQREYLTTLGMSFTKRNSEALDKMQIAINKAKK